MNYEEFWLKTWKIVACSIVAGWLIGATSCQMTRYQVRKAIDAGASPLEARCAIDTSADSSTLCGVVAGRAKP